MFDYPIFEMPFIGQRMLMAINAIIHVFVSHGGAVGGSVVLAAMAWWANKKNDMAAYNLTFKVVVFFPSSIPVNIAWSLAFSKS